jgi:1-deoxy-D-xylulose-5-phosphate synthase
VAVLERINGPKDLKALTMKELKALAGEVREEMVNTVAKTGGHLASSLGAVELAIALHYVFGAPEDKIVWDIGHQAYAHKLLTGRRDQFASLRQPGGISGFLKPGESPYDCFGAGHAATSISAALGLARAYAHRGQPVKVVAVIGDGAMSAGMAFEALNNAGQMSQDLIIVLNDNEMSISPSVGALSSFLSRKLTGPFFTGLKREILSIFSSIPGVGRDMVKIARRAEDALKGFLTPGMLFESLGFQYIGPIDGHRLESLIPTLTNTKAITGPVLIHALTRKGKGYPPAEQNPVRFHSSGPFDVKTGEEIRNPAPPSYTEVFADALGQLAEEDDRIVAITAAMASGTGLDQFTKRFPNRSFDVGIAEQHAVTFAAGLASQGLRPVVAIYSTFLQRGYDQTLHDVCLQKLPVVFVLDRSGIVGQDGPTHQGVFDLSYLRSMPNMTVMAPKDENELRHMLKTSLEMEGPAAIRYPRGKGTGVRLDPVFTSLPVGKAEILMEGKDLAILALGATVSAALEAGANLEKKKIYATVVNCRFAKPLDAELILSLAEQPGRIITVEENVLAGGFGSSILELLSQKGDCPARVKRLGVPDEFVEQGPPQMLRAKYKLDAVGIEQEALALLDRNAARKKRASR